LKSRFSVIRFSLGILVIILSISVLIGNADSKVVLPYMMACLGFFQVFNGLCLYKEGKKPDAILSILSSIFILGVVIKVIFL